MALLWVFSIWLEYQEGNEDSGLLISFKWLCSHCGRHVDGGVGSQDVAGTREAQLQVRVRGLSEDPVLPSAWCQGSEGPLGPPHSPGGGHYCLGQQRRRPGCLAGL